MHLRPALPTDMYTCGQIQAICNKQDTLTRYFIRNTDKYPTTYLRSSIRFVKRHCSAPGAVCMVLETSSSDHSPLSTSSQQHTPRIVVGYAIFRRTGTSPTAQTWKSQNLGLWHTINHFLDNLEDIYLRWFPSVEPTFSASHFQRVLPYLLTPFDRDVFAEAWEVDSLFVHPEWQRKGLGRKLLNWVCDRATEEKVPVVVKSSSLGVAAYRACGFQLLGQSNMRELFDTLEFGGEEPGLLVWEPEDLKGRWVGRGREALLRWMREMEGK